MADSCQCMAKKKKKKNPLQYFKVISLQLIKINENKKQTKSYDNNKKDLNFMKNIYWNLADLL